MAVMRHSALCLALAFISASHAFAQNAVADWFPLHIGDQWIYEHERRDEAGVGPAELAVHRWKSEETVIGLWAAPEGTLVERRIRVSEGSPPMGYHVNAYPAYLIRDDCLYVNDVDWDPVSHQLTPAFRKDLFAGHIAADFCFPLVAGKTWGAPHWGDWRSPAEAKDWQVQASSVQPKTFHITSVSSYPGSGETVDVWFGKGLGIAREVEIHHGTIGEERTLLLRFEPASAGPAARSN
jgi:hypothetical protein